MTDRTPENPPNAPADDALVDLYREATQQDRGPDAAARERVLAHAREQTARRKPATTLVTEPPQRREAANDRRWLRHALGSLAIIGVVGWLTLQHLQEPGAPQLDQAAPSVQQSSPAPQSAPAAAPSAAESNANSDTAADRPPAPVSDVKEEPNTVSRPAPAARRQRAQEDAIERERAVEKAVSPSAPRSAPVPAPAATPAPAPMSRSQESAPAPQPVPSPSPSRAAEGSIRAPSSMQDRAMGRIGGDHNKTQQADALDLVDCDENMQASALAEQARRIKARDEAVAAGQPLPDPAPVCRPRAAVSPASQ
ncbi:hypothetical protein [Diaphorobacter aerolatus]|uniref:Uncharacterized protein n=1 Tax=Diaphorobacter aerolatus TaxID=1288495 RepID=A0A7H0GIN0_9BURK|nr:hypothetical protein [Diaphorobacter aerolatus]QNP48146.1 hypothetical protein H9K75_19210 [Diaphorobacter aerolatus]